MSKEQPHVTIKDIGDACGVSATTVSLALRNHPRISDKTKAKVQEAANELGYKRNPLVAALMSRLKSAQTSYIPVPLAAVCDMPLDQIEKHLYHKTVWGGVSKRARELGFSIDPFHLPDERPSSGKHLTNMLYSRGICGVLVLPLSQNDGQLSLDWSRFSSVAIGYSMQKPGLHRICPDQYHGIRLALEKARQRGYTRPGLVISQQTARRTLYLRSSGFYGYEYSLKTPQIIPVLEYNGTTPSQLIDWFKTYRPDVIISPNIRADEWTALETCGVRIPLDVGLISLSNHSTEINISGVDECEDYVGEMAVDRLAQLLYQNEQGIPARPTTLEIAPSWIEGETLPVKRNPS